MCSNTPINRRIPSKTNIAHKTTSHAAGKALDIDQGIQGWQVHGDDTKASLNNRQAILESLDKSEKKSGKKLGTHMTIQDITDNLEFDIHKLSGLEDRASPVY